jgi:Zn-dependent protease with chaperone function
MPYIVMNTGLIELFDEDQLRIVIAHELGHIKCEHTILIQMALWAMGAANILGELTLGIGDILSTGLILAFFEWRRKAELSADRAALLVTDNLEQVMYTMMGLAGGTQKYAHECSLPEFINQSKEYQDLNQDGLNQVYKFLIYNGGRNGFLEHPFAVERLHFIQEWANSSEYATIKSGTYARAGQKGAVDVAATESNKTSEAEDLQAQVERLQQEIDRLRKGNK